MRHECSIDGVYARWTLTVRVQPPDDDPDQAPPEPDFHLLTSIFRDQVNGFELARDLEARTASRGLGGF